LKILLRINESFHYIFALLIPTVLINKIEMKQYRDLKEKRVALTKCKKILEPFGEYLIVTRGASVSCVKKQGIIKEMRELLKAYEIKNGEDPNHDWSKDIKG